MNGPDPLNPHPMEGFPQVCYIKNIITNPNIIVGDYTYYDDPDRPDNLRRHGEYNPQKSFIAGPTSPRARLRPDLPNSL